MKLNKLFLGAIAALASAAMVACSDDAPDNPGGENTIGKEGGYIAVNIVAPSGASSRGSSAADDLEYGKPDENRVENITFFIFNQDGTPYQAPIFYPAPTPAEGETEGKFEQEVNGGNPVNNIEKILRACLITSEK